VKHDWIITSPGTISALSVAVTPFERTVRLAGRQVLYNQLMLNNSGEQKCSFFAAHIIPWDVFGTKKNLKNLQPYSANMKM